MLTGKISQSSSFEPDDHRAFNRHGEAFDRGETFSGVEYGTALKAVEHLRPLVPKGATLTQMALRWILMFSAVTCAIPGAKRPSQVTENAGAAALPLLDGAVMKEITRIYDDVIRPQVHHYW